VVFSSSVACPGKVNPVLAEVADQVAALSAW
jgi:aspartate ammonia-lyase